MSTLIFRLLFLVYFGKTLYNVIVDLEVNMRDIFMKLKKSKYKFYTNLILVMLLTILNIHLIYSIFLLSGIENILRIIVIVVIILIWLLFAWSAVRMLIKHNKVKYITFLMLIIIYIAISGFVSFNVNKIYSKLSNVSNVYATYSTSLVTDINNPVKSITKIGDAKIGILNDENSVDGFQIPKDIIKNKKLTNEVVYFDSYLLLIEALDKKEVEYIFVPTNYRIMFENVETINEILEKTKIIYTEGKQIARKVSNRGKMIDKPFTMLLMGVDSKAEDISSGTFNGDALMVLTFNPKTLNTTIVSIPRDSYVPITCFNGKRKNKITHAAWYGEDCMIETIENFLDIDIDYYFKINFKGVVKLVDALGGIEVDVPYTFCEQDSKRRWGKNIVYVKKGVQTLNGEQALALSRNRKNNSRICGEGWGIDEVNDFVRGQNQQLVIKGLLNKAKSVKRIDTLYKILDTISNSMETNMQTSEILSFYNIGKDILDKSRAMDLEEILGFQRLYISGYSKYIMDYSAFDNQGMRANLYNFVPYRGSIQDITDAMNINLGKKDKTVIKTLRFSINEPYEEKVIGKGYYNEAAIPLLPSFIGSQEIKAVEYANRNNFKLNINHVTSDNPNHVVGQIIAQRPYADMDINYVKDITIDVVKTLNVTKKPDTIPNCSLEENKEHSLCLLPNFVDKEYSYFKDWLRKYNLSINIIEVPIKEGDADYNNAKVGQIIYQSKASGTSIYDLIGNSLTIKYIELKITENPVDENPVDENPVDENPIVEEPEDEVADEETPNPDIEDVIPGLE